MQTFLVVVVVASLAFIGTMFDNFFAFAAQLIVTGHEKYRRVAWAQAIAVAVLVALAAGIGTLLAPVPLRWVGLLCVAPFSFAIYAWRHRQQPREQFKRGSVTTFAVTLALGGDNIAVWIPLLRANGVARALVTVAVFACWEAVFILTAQRLTKHPKVVTWGRAHAPSALPVVYFLLGVLILVECRTF
ncbi:MAG: cadmium resistance transporter [Acidimicrobiales bacterium]